jgi:hypothetical protein
MPTPHTSSSSSFPTFPDHIICGLAKEFVDLYTPIRETPPQFLWLAFITYLGNSISKSIRLDIAYSEPRLFGVAIGRSARTKKSTGNNLARDLFRLVQGDRQHVVQGFGSAEGLLTDLSKHAGIPTLIHLDEINILAQKTNIDGSVGISALHKLFEDHDYDHTLAGGRGYQVRGARLSLLGASTLDDFLKTWTKRHADAGFFSRLFFVGADWMAKRIPRPVRADEAKTQTLADKTKALIAELDVACQRNNGTPVEYPLDDDAAAAWDAFYNTFGDGKEWDRVDTYGFRLMVIQAVLKSQRTITKETVDQVVDLLRYEVAVRRTVQPVIADNAIAEMEQMIMRYLPDPGDPIRRRELYRKVHAERKSPIIFNRAIHSLANDDQLSISTVQTAKGLSECYARVLEDDDDTEGVPKNEVTPQAPVKAKLIGDEMILSPVPPPSPTSATGIQSSV